MECKFHDFDTLDQIMKGIYIVFQTTKELCEKALNHRRGKVYFTQYIRKLLPVFKIIEIQCSDTLKPIPTLHTAFQFSDQIQMSPVYFANLLSRSV